MIYILIFLLLLFLSFRYDINGRKKGRDRWYCAILLVFVLLAGLRWRLGVDTPNYLNWFYYRYPSLKDFSMEDFAVGKDPLFVLLNSVIISIGGKFYLVQLMQSAFVNILIFKYIKKHSMYIFTCILFYYLVSYLGYNMEIMRGSMSIVLCLFANDYFIEKKWIRGVLLYLVALMFHIQTVLLFIVPFLLFLRFNKLGACLVLFSIVLGFLLQIYLGDFLESIDLGDTIEDKATRYAESEKYGGQKGNVFFFFITIWPKIVYTLLSLFFIRKWSPQNRILKLEPFAMIGLIFLSLQMNLQIAYRYVDYFLIYFCLFFSEFFVIFTHNINSKMSGYIKAVLIFLPFLILIEYPYFVTKRARYYPYNSIIDRMPDKERELLYSNYNRPKPIVKEY